MLKQIEEALEVIKKQPCKHPQQKEVITQLVDKVRELQKSHVLIENGKFKYMEDICGKWHERNEKEDVSNYKGALWQN